MLTPLAIGISLLLTNVLIQTIAVWRVVRYLARKLAREREDTSELGEGATLAVVAIFVSTGHLIQVGIWALVFLALGEFDGFRNAFYHSAVNFTTLGYGDIVMSEQWRLLGALEAGSGILMFGVSTALFFALISRLLERRIKMAHQAKQ